MAPRQWRWEGPGGSHLGSPGTAPSQPARDPFKLYASSRSFLGLSYAWFRPTPSGTLCKVTPVILHGVVRSDFTQSVAVEAAGGDPRPGGDEHVSSSLFFITLGLELIDTQVYEP